MNVLMGLFMIGAGIFLCRFVENDMGMLIVSLWMIAGIFLASMPSAGKPSKGNKQRGINDIQSKDSKIS